MLRDTDTSLGGGDIDFGVEIVPMGVQLCPGDFRKATACIVISPR